MTKLDEAMALCERIEYQFPMWPVTLSACSVDGCGNSARGGGKCWKHLTDDLAELVGETNADQFIGGLLKKSHAISFMQELLDGDDD